MKIQNNLVKTLLGAFCAAAVSLLPQSIAAQTIKLKWEKLPGRSLDVGVGHRGHVWSIGPNRQAWKLVGKKWIVAPGLKDLINIDAGPDGSAMAVRKDGTL